MFGIRPTGRVGALLLAVTLLGGCGAAATPSSAIQPAAVPSPTANPDEALVGELAAVWANPYDEATVAALYAPDAVVHETTANETQTGLEEIGKRIVYFYSQDFKVVVTSAPIRQGDFVAHFVKYGAGNAVYPGLVVYELKEGKVVNQWIYPAP